MDGDSLTMGTDAGNLSDTETADEDDCKGNQVIFIAGKYINEKGWLNKKKKATPKCFHVIIEKNEDKGRNCEIERHIAKKNMKVLLDDYASAPDCYEAAVLIQHPDLEVAMEKLAKELARCSIQRPSNLRRIFEEKLAAAIVEQNEGGHKTSWRKVEWE